MQGLSVNKTDFETVLKGNGLDQKRAQELSKLTFAKQDSLSFKAYLKLEGLYQDLGLNLVFEDILDGFDSIASHKLTLREEAFDQLFHYDARLEITYKDQYLGLDNERTRKAKFSKKEVLDFARQIFSNDKNKVKTFAKLLDIHFAKMGPKYKELSEQGIINMITSDLYSEENLDGLQLKITLEDIKAFDELDLNSGAAIYDLTADSVKAVLIEDYGHNPLFTRSNNMKHETQVTSRLGKAHNINARSIFTLTSNVEDDDRFASITETMQTLRRIADERYQNGASPLIVNLSQATVMIESDKKDKAKALEALNSRFGTNVTQDFRNISEEDKLKIYNQLIPQEQQLILEYKRLADHPGIKEIKNSLGNGAGFQINISSILLSKHPKIRFVGAKDFDTQSPADYNSHGVAEAYETTNDKQFTPNVDRPLNGRNLDQVLVSDEVWDAHKEKLLQLGESFRELTFLFQTRWRSSQYESDPTYISWFQDSFNHQRLKQFGINPQDQDIFKHSTQGKIVGIQSNDKLQQVVFEQVKHKFAALGIDTGMAKYVLSQPYPEDNLIELLNSQLSLLGYGSRQCVVSEEQMRNLFANDKSALDSFNRTVTKIKTHHSAGTPVVFRLDNVYRLMRHFGRLESYFFDPQQRILYESGYWGYFFCKS